MIFIMTREKQTSININRGLNDINTRQQTDAEQPKPPSDQIESETSQQLQVRLN